MPSASEPALDWSEARFKSWVVARAKERGWRVCETQPWARGNYTRANRDWPDLMLLRGALVFTELKSQGAKPYTEQQQIIDMLVAAGQEVYVWRPGDAEKILERLDR